MLGDTVIVAKDTWSEAKAREAYLVTPAATAAPSRWLRKRPCGFAEDA